MGVIYDLDRRLGAHRIAIARGFFRHGTALQLTFASTFMTFFFEESSFPCSPQDGPVIPLSEVILQALAPHHGSPSFSLHAFAKGQATVLRQGHIITVPPRLVSSVAITDSEDMSPDEHAEQFLVKSTRPTQQGLLDADFTTVYLLPASTPQQNTDSTNQGCVLNSDSFEIGEGFLEKGLPASSSQTKSIISQAVRNIGRIVTQ